MSTTVEAPPVDAGATLLFDAGSLARGWLSVALASGTDDEVPVLYRTVLLEAYSHGVRIVATDRYVLLCSWVSTLGPDAPEPPTEELPDRTAIAIDERGRAKGLLTHLLALAAAANRDEVPYPTIELGIGVPDLGDGPEPTLAGMGGSAVVLSHPSRELVKLRTYDGRYPDWRLLTASFSPVAVGAVALNPEILGRLAKLGKYHWDRPIRWQFSGAHKLALIEVVDSLPSVHGGVMPMRLAGDGS